MWNYSHLLCLQGTLLCPQGALAMSSGRFGYALRALCSALRALCYALRALCSALRSFLPVFRVARPCGPPLSVLSSMVCCWRGSMPSYRLLTPLFNKIDCSKNVFQDSSNTSNASFHQKAPARQPENPLFGHVNCYTFEEITCPKLYRQVILTFSLD